MTAFTRNPIVHFVVALFVGIVAGLGAVVFRKMIAAFHNLFFFGRFSFAYNTLLHTAPSSWGEWIVFAPVLGGLGVAWLVQRFAPEAKGHGVPEVMDAIYYQKGHMRPQVVLVKAVASALNIGSGGSVGREGPIIQMGAAFAANLSRWLRLDEWQRYALIAAGAGGGIAATFNTPIGGMLFAVELMMPEISARTLVPVMVTTGTATYVSRNFLGRHPAFIISSLRIAETANTSPQAFFSYLLFGILVGLASLFFIRSIYFFEDIFDSLPGSYYTRHALGMLVVGLIIYELLNTTGHYFVQGVGYATVQDILAMQLTMPALLLIGLAAIKLLVTSLTLGSGGSGGVFSPSLFIGATLGALYALLSNRISPAVDLNVTTAAAIGMAAMIGASTGAALTGAVMIFEMTGDDRIILPLIVVVSVAYGVRRLITADTIYTLKLLRRGHEIPQSLQSNLYLITPASEFARNNFACIPASASWSSAAHRGFTRDQRQHLVLIGADSQIVGVVPARSIPTYRYPGNVDLRSMAQTEWSLLPADSLVVDLLAAVRRGGPNVFILSEASSCDPERIKAVLLWSDIVQAAGLPSQKQLCGTVI